MVMGERGRRAAGTAPWHSKDEGLPLSSSIWFCHHSLDGLLTPMASRSEGDQPVLPQLGVLVGHAQDPPAPSTQDPRGDEPPWAAGDGCGCWSSAPSTVPLLALARL